MRQAWLASGLFFGLYLWTMPPALPPYRDAGEMSVSARTLGVSHPTSYPLYILLGRAAETIPLGNPAYRLTLLSALGGAAAVGVLFALCRSRWGAAPAWGAALLLGFNGTFWSVCLVPEMYSLWVLGAIVLAGSAWRLRESPSARGWLGFAGLYGLILANRLDILLWAPGLLWLSLSGAGGAVWPVLAFLVFPALMVATDSNMPIVPLILGTAIMLRRGERWNWAARTALFGALGLSAYLYLPVRSASGPWLDWNHPAAFSNLAESLLRTKYGGTLDLLSKNYAKGELFGENMRVYARHLWDNFSVVGLAAAVAGLGISARRDFARFLGFAALYWWSGPVFLFMANLPPNPHALAIVEPHYLLSDLVLVLWAAEGLSAFPAAPAAAAALGLVPLLMGRPALENHREHLFTYDFAKSAFKSAPPGAAVVAKKDVQLYTLWHYQTVQGWRPDLRLVSQGLAGSAWYQAGWRRRDAAFPIGPLRGAEQWRSFASAGIPVFATMDVEATLERSEMAMGGLLAAVRRASPGDPADFFCLRGDYSYENQPDFFTSDIVDSFSQASYRRGTELFSAGNVEAAVVRLKTAWAMHWELPEPALFLGYVEMSRGRLQDAKRYYELAVALYDKTLSLTEAYHSLPDLKESVRRSAADARIHLGVSEEKLGNPAAAESRYQESLAIHPFAQAHFNMAVLYWNKDWRRVEAELQEALRLDPGHAEAARYLALLRSRR